MVHCKNHFIPLEYKLKGAWRWAVRVYRDLHWVWTRKQRWKPTKNNVNNVLTSAKNELYWLFTLRLNLGQWTFWSWKESYLAFLINLSFESMLAYETDIPSESDGTCSTSTVSHLGADMFVGSTTVVMQYGSKTPEGIGVVSFKPDVIWMSWLVILSETFRNNVNKNTSMHFSSNYYTPLIINMEPKKCRFGRLPPFSNRWFIRFHANFPGCNIWMSLSQKLRTPQKHLEW